MTEEELLLQKKRLELEKEMAEADEDIAPQQIAPARMPQPETPVSSPEAMARGLSDVLTFGTAKYVAPAIRGGLHAVLPKKASEFLSLDPYDVEKERYAEREKIAKEYEPGSYLGGQALGIGSQVLAAPFTGAVQGARLGIPAATRALAGQAFESFPGQAALGGLQAGTESSFDPIKVLEGMGVGGGLQQFGKWGTQAAQPALESAAYSRAAKATGADILKPSRRIARMPGGRQAYGKDVLEQGIVTAGKTVPEIAEAAKAQESKQGQIIGQIYQKFDELAGGKVPDGFMENLIARIQKDVIAPLRKTAAKSDMADRLESAYVNRLAEMVDQGYQPSFQGLHDEVSGLADKAYTPTGIDKPLNEQLQKIQRLMRGEMQKEAGKLEGGTDLLDMLQKANRKYSVATEAAKTATEKAQRMATNRQLSLSDYLSGGIGAAAGGFTGGGVGTLVGTAAGAVFNKILRERGPQVAASMLNAAQKMAKNNPELVGVYLNFLAGEKATQALPGGKEQ